jgi:DnaK suppressor protein
MHPKRTARYRFNRWEVTMTAVMHREVVRANGGVLSGAMLARLQLRLGDERRAAFARMERKLFEARAVNDGDVGDDLDKAAEGAEVNRLLAAARKERVLIREIDRALGKLETGEFGVCEGTGEPIDPRRLEAQPWTRYSRAFLEMLELQRAGP